VRFAKRAYKQRNPFFGVWPVFKKEVIHIIRDSWTFYFVVGITIGHLLIIGFGVNAKIRQVKTVVYDLSNTQESRELIQRFINTDSFKIVTSVNSDKELYNTLITGKARVGIKIPVDYARRVLANEPANVLVLVDGSNAAVTSEVLNVSVGLTLEESLKKLKLFPSIQARPSVLFNPDTLTPFFNIPGVVPFEMELIITFLVATAMVRERERGTMEQLFMTPIQPLGMMVGKVIPYAIVGLLMESEMFLVAHYVFDLPIKGSYGLLVLLTIPFLIALLGMGLMISIIVNSISEAVQLVVGQTFPSIYLSGYFFEIDSMPIGFQWAAEILPTTHFIRITRGILLRGAGFESIWKDALALLIIGVVLIGISAYIFQRKRVQ